MQRARAFTSRGPLPRNPLSMPAALMSRTMASASFAVSGVTRMAVSFSSSTKMPPRPKRTTWPNSLSLRAPMMTSVPSGAIFWTRQRFAFMALKAFRSSASERMPNATPPFSVLCSTPASAVLSATGYRSRRAARAASSALRATAASAAGTP
ncbi:MAG: hypothetical protein A4E67_00957 [Syntrophaceae bacterium PtaB.Bin038]|nr:MAG: hypothetical protein A4E67_00957 [Syntrophaceae bacterium PtaB.Bin038]